MQEEKNNMIKVKVLFILSSSVSPVVNEFAEKYYHTKVHHEAKRRMLKTKKKGRKIRWNDDIINYIPLRIFLFFLIFLFLAFYRKTLLNILFSPFLGLSIWILLKRENKQIIKYPENDYTQTNGNYIYRYVNSGYIYSNDVYTQIHM